MSMARLTRVRVEQELLARAQQALGVGTTRAAAVERALRRVVDQAQGEQAHRAASQLRYLESLPARVDLGVLAEDQMWR